MWFFVAVLISLAAWFAWESRREGGCVHPAMGGLIAATLASAAALTALAIVGGA